MAAVPLEHGLILAGRPLRASAWSGVLVRRNILFILLSIEIMLNAAGLAFVAAGARWGQPDGQVMFIFILTMAAAEVSVGLALVLQLYQPVQDAGRRRRQQDARLRCCELLWLIPALPLAGFLVLALVGRRLSARGRRRRRRRARSALSAVAGDRCVALGFLAAPPAGSAYHADALDLDAASAASTPAIAFYLDALSLVMIAGRHLRRLPDPPLLGRVHGRRRGLQPLLRLHEPVRRLDADPGAGRQPAAALPGLGRRRPVQLPADRLLVPATRPTAARRARRSSSRASATRPWPIGLFLLFTSLGTLDIQELMRAGRAAVAGRLGAGRRRGRAAAGRRGRQVGPAAAADLAARRHGRPDAGQRPDPRRHDGDRRRLPDRPHARPLRAGAGRAAGRGGHRRG